MVQGAIGLKIAVVTISHARKRGDDLPGEWIAAVLQQAGHHVVERVCLDDDLAAIRGRFASWVAGSTVNVVIATCDLRSTCTAAALAPLITEPLAGFGDMLQRLALEDGRNAAALVDATAARCDSTFVFLLPASTGALRIALDRLVLTQVTDRDEAREIAPSPDAPVTEEPAARTKTISAPPPVPARALARSEIDELFSEPILLVTANAPVRKRNDSSPAFCPMISIPIGRADHDAIADVSSWAPPRPRKRRTLQATLIASLVMMASAVAIVIPHVTERQPPTRAHVAASGPTSAAAARSEVPTRERLATVAREITPSPAEPAPAAAPSPRQRVANPEIEMAPETMYVVEPPAVETPPAPDKPAAEPAVAEAPATKPAAVEPAPGATENEAPSVASSCDEVSCALDSYAGACCAKFKPAEVATPKPASQLPAQIERAMIVDGMAKMKPAISRCDKRFGVRGTVNLKIKVGPDGAVEDVSVASSPDAALGDCVAAAIRNASFAMTAIGGSFRYPFVF